MEIHKPPHAAAAYFYFFYFFIFCVVFFRGARGWCAARRCRGGFCVTEAFSWPVYHFCKTWDMGDINTLPRYPCPHPPPISPHVGFCDCTAPALHGQAKKAGGPSEWWKCFALHYSDKDLKIEKRKKQPPSLPNWPNHWWDRSGATAARRSARLHSLLFAWGDVKDLWNGRPEGVLAD